MAITPQLQSLIDKQDTSEIVRDQIAAILCVEVAQQQNLARAAGKKRTQWLLDIYSERDQPWGCFQDLPNTSENQRFQPPIVNVSFDNDSFDKNGSNSVERQRTTATFFIDCYGYGVAHDSGMLGHKPGDLTASLEAQRAARIVRNILMSSYYTYLRLQGTVWSRWLQSRQVLGVQLDSKAAFHVVGVRMTFEVVFSEFSPQYQGQPIELISTTVRRAETGQIFLRADFSGE